MKEMLEKISSYNIFNYLLPGILFALVAKPFLGWDLIQKDLLVGAFLYYFIGLVISRLGSLVLEPLLKKFSFIKFSDYKNFVTASKKDNKIELLSEINNMYRTLLSLCISLVISKLVFFIQSILAIQDDISNTILLIALAFLFLLSYKKQTTYITKRIEANL
jgi:hypothetical protein